jgi:hypothetical protein
MSDEITGKARGGFARAEVLTPSKRSEIARKAAAARWGGEQPRKATHTGDLKIGDITIPCYVLDGGIRVLSRRGVSAAFTGGIGGGRARNDGERNLPRILTSSAVRPFLSNELVASANRAYEFQPVHGGRTAFGSEAELLPMMCEAILDANRAGVLKNPEVAKTAEVLLRGLARVGIVALVDEATGYQEVRPKDALQGYLEKIVRKELAAWVKTFPDEFYKNIYKLKNWPWPGMSKNRYSVVAHYTNDLVYERIAPGLLAELQLKNPKDEKGRRKSKNTQWLTAEIGHPLLAQHLYSLMMFQRLAIAQGYGWNRFVKMVDKVHPKKGSTMELFDDLGDLDS